MKKTIVALALSVMTTPALAVDPEVEYQKVLKLFDQKDYKATFSAIQPLADKGYPPAIASLGYLYEQGFGVKKDPKKSCELYKEAAEKGVNNAMHGLGYCHYDGYVTGKIDYPKAKYWFEKAVENGFSDGNNGLGWLYYKGLGVEKDYTKARDLFKKSIEAGSSAAKTNLDKLDRHIIKYLTSGNNAYQKEDYDTARKNWEIVADYGIGDGYNNLALLYRAGKGVEKNTAKACKLNKKGGELGHSISKIGYAECLFNGHAEEGRNPGKAIKTYETLAKDGNAHASLEMMWIHMTGRGTPVDFDKAEEWRKTGVQQAKETNKDLLASFEKQKKRLDADKAKKAKCATGFKFLGAPVACTSRKEFREVVKAKGAKPLRERNSYWADKYDSSALVSGSDKLYIYYNNDNQFARAVYEIPARMDSKKVIEIKDMLAMKYGAPDSSTGRDNVGIKTFTWNLKDGMRLTVKRGWPDTSVEISYILDENNKQMEREFAEYKKQQAEKKYKSQLGNL